MVHQFDFETLNGQQTGGRRLSVKALDSCEAEEHLCLERDEIIVKAWKNGDLVFDPFLGFFK